MPDHRPYVVKQRTFNDVKVYTFKYLISAMERYNNIAHDPNTVSALLVERTYFDIARLERTIAHYTRTDNTDTPANTTLGSNT